jgi:hypothetical protein
MTPEAVNACSLWEYAAAIDGWLRSQGVDQTPAPTDDEFDEWIAKYG